MVQDDSAAPQTDEFQKLQEELRKLKELAARAQADLQNAKMRMEKEALDIRLFAVEGLIVRLLPTIDNLRRAFEHLPDELRSHDWVKGLQVTEQQMLSDLEAVGLRPIEALGLPVDTQRHEVLQSVPGKLDIVVQVLENGYELHGKVIRPAKVVVGDGEEEMSS